MRQALGYMRAGQAAAARPLWRRALVEYPALRDYHLYYLGLAEASAGDVAAAQAQFETLRREEPDSVLRPYARLQLGRLFAPTDPEAAVQHLRAARKGLSVGSAEWAKASLQLASLEVQRGNAGGAYRVLVDVRTHVGPGNARRRARRASQALAETRPELSLDRPERALQEARLLLREGDAAAAERVLRRVLDSPHPTPLRPELLSLLGTAQFDQKELDSAEQTLKRLLREYPTDELAPSSLLALARWRWNRDEDAVALDRFRSFLERYPRHPRVPDVLLAVAKIHQAGGRFDTARTTYREIGARFPHSEAAIDARWRLAWLDYWQGDHAAAAESFARLAASQQKGERERALYWQARATERARGTAAAWPLFTALVTEFPDGYYAIWAESALAGAVSAAPGGTEAGGEAQPVQVVAVGSGPSDTGTPPTDPRSLAALAEEPGASALDGERFRRAVDLEAMGLPQHAARELNAIPFPPASSMDAQLVLLEAYERVGAYRRALRLSVAGRPTGEAIGRHPMDRFAYPRGYWDLLRQQGGANQLDPMLVAAVIRQESGFDASAVSPKGARGLMQLMPQTAARIAGDLGQPAPSARDLERPAVNIPLGATYLGQLVQMYDGGIYRAVAAYNAGEDAVAKWDRRFGEAPPDEFVEQITYAETRDYVKAVMRGYRRYRSIYNGDGSAPEVSPAATVRPAEPPPSATAAPVARLTAEKPAGDADSTPKPRRPRRRASPPGRPR
jgi:soluble lytic murein transglycosylase